MKKIILILALFLAVGCSNKEEDFNKFMDTYKEILLVRESISDSSEANSKVREIIQQHGYKMEEFKDEFYNLAKKSPQFAFVVDSLRKTFKQEINKLQDSIKSADIKAKADSSANSEK